jgi:capsular exopolysaccharide synthesis family protein
MSATEPLVGEIQEALRRAALVRKAAQAVGSAPAESEPPRERDFPAAPPPIAAPLEREPARVVPLSHEKTGAWKARGLVVEDAGPAPEMLRHLAIRLRRELEARNARTVAVVSAQRAEGKTTMSCNLALALASLGERRGIALVDLDLRNPSVADGLGLSCDAGIDDVLLGQADLAAARLSLDEPPLDAYPCRRRHQNAHRMLTLASFPATLRALERQYEVVVLDTPPILLVPDAAIILQTVSAAVVVVRAGISRQRAVEALRKHMPPNRLIGSILNEGQQPISKHSYGYYGAPPDAEG